MSIATRTKQLRKDANLTQQALSKETGLSRLMISKVETGENQPTVKHIEVLCKFFGCTSDFIINGDDMSLNQQEVNIIKLVRNDKILLKRLIKIIDSKKDLDMIAA